MSVFAKAQASRSRTLKAVLSGIAVVGASALVLSGCAATSPEGKPTGPREDLTLKIGTILPKTGSLDFLGPPEIAGVGLAAADINEANLGIKVEVTYGDSGDTENKAYETEVPRVLAEGVSAVIGAAASGVSKLFIDQVTGAGVIQVSPANTSVDFTNWDDNGLYFRTAPSDVLQGEVLGNLVGADGIKNLAIINREDSYGTGLGAQAKSAFEATGGKIVSQQSYKETDKDYSAQISATLAAKPEAIALISFVETKTILPLLAQAGFDMGKIYLVDGNLANYPEFNFSLEGSKGTLPGLDTGKLGDFTDRLQAYWKAEGNSELTEYSYAAESYDAVVLLALAALSANSTDGKAMAAKLQEVSGGSGDGKKADDFASAAQIILDGGVADYDGLSGPITFDKNGDPTEATIGVYTYQKDNSFKRTGDG
ncbi:MAG: ABC transporter substrate-binding protein [Microbacteriaceae bacterium]